VYDVSKKNNTFLERWMVGGLQLAKKKYFVSSTIEDSLKNASISNLKGLLNGKL